MKIYIEVGGGLVLNVYANALVDVEVIDTDTTDPDEWAERTETLNEIKKDPDFVLVW